MTNITDAIDQLFEEKGLPLKKEQAADGNFVYNGMFTLQPNKPIHFSLVVQNQEDVADYQVVFDELAFVTSFDKKAAVLERLNALNISQTAHYTAILAADGEIYIRVVSRISKENVKPLYDIMVVGSSIAYQLLPNLAEVI
ncbi:hypothetical protein [Granulicatella seriolae]|uniref:YbjN domain-containing protein n=1 Tax=Granulicatella seriolae TaxID=2967226 RepID=A0ABT1WNT3_9LACT|nr:hypothetical protein [Granulicatella seriolae]